ncbi:MAG: peptidylprolyl isomerase [Polyangiaceae bacterium]
MPIVRRIPLALAICFTTVLGGCDDAPLATAPDGGTVAGLTAEQASRTVAKVGDRVITLGDFARSLERMDQFDRLRYQTKERRREQLGDIVDVELLAAEARRRGLDKQPENEDAIRQILRDAMLARARADLPPPANIAADEVRAYWDTNQGLFREPERRRVSAIIMEDRAAAQKVLEAAQKIKSPEEWGALHNKHSINANKQKSASPADLAGDLGIVGPPDDPKGANPRVPEVVRAAVFTVVTKVGDVGAALVESDGKFFILRLSGITAAHARSLQESDRSIRVAILQQRMLEKEKQLEADLRQKITVEIDERALASVKMPEGLDKTDTQSAASPGPRQVRGRRRRRCARPRCRRARRACRTRRCRGPLNRG